MDTNILQIDEQSLKKASQIINKNDLVAFPTETVYGLGANAFCDEAVKKIFVAKGRPQDNPLIVHIDSFENAHIVCEDIPQKAKELAKVFMPGPLTIVMKKRQIISQFVSCGLDTVALRVPSHKGAKAFLKACGVPIAAPSANTSKRPSPTSAKHVLEDLQGKIELILDGGDCERGIESTVIDLTSEIPTILRPGTILKSQIEKVIGKVQEFSGEVCDKIKSPGVKYTHYAPKCKMIVIKTNFLNESLKQVQKAKLQGQNAVVLCYQDVFNQIEDKQISKFNLGKNDEEAISNFYMSLRVLEKQYDLIICQSPTQTEIGNSLFNRMKKSCGGNIIE